MPMMRERLTHGAWIPPWVRHEHLARYAFAAQHVSGKTVVDWACGDGTSSETFARAGATVVIGFDYSEATMAVARRRYRAPNLRFMVGNVLGAPLPSAWADLSIALELIEHVDQEHVFLDEVVRITKPDGLFLCSTPNRTVTNPGAGFTDRPWNAFHVREYTPEELIERLAKRFRHVELYGQNPTPHLNVVAMGTLGRFLPRSGVTTLNQALKFPRLVFDRLDAHAVQPMRRGQHYEYLVALCREPRGATTTRLFLNTPGRLTPHPPRVAVCLVDKDYGRTYLPDCYTSLQQQTYPAESFTVFLVHDGATEADKQFAQHLAPEARFLEHTQTKGWGAANNTAIRVALAEGFDYLVMLNLDTVVDPDWLTRLVEMAQQHHDLHILQSKLMLYGTNKINSVGNRIQYLGYGYCDGYGMPATTPNGHATLDFASGAAMLVKREVFERIGFFREDYVWYCDDLEFCWRARLAGFNVGLAERSVCHHRYRASSIMNFFYYRQRNRLLTLFTLEKLPTILVTMPCLVVAEIVAGLWCFATGWGSAQWKVVRYFCSPYTWRLIAARRREIGTLRRRNDAEVVKQFAGTVRFGEAMNPLLRYVLNPLLWVYWAVVRRLIIW